MIRDAQKPDKASVYELWKQAYPNQNRNYLNFYFKNIFEQGTCIVYEQDMRIVSTLQLQEHILQLHDKHITVSYLLGVATHPDYRRRGYMQALMESILDEASHKHVITLIEAFHPKLYEQFGFETIYYHKLYTIPKAALHTVVPHGISYSAEPQELLHVYRQFISHFNGSYTRDVTYYQLLLKEIIIHQKQLIVYRNHSGVMCGYLIVQRKKNELHVEEAIYLESIALLRMLKAAIQKEEEIVVEVSQCEKLEKLFPLCIPKKQPYMMARINHPALFSKLYNHKVHSICEAFALSKKPLWIHEYY